MSQPLRRVLTQPELLDAELIDEFPELSLIER
jgi:hypothetical protein